MKECLSTFRLSAALAGVSLLVLGLVANGVVLLAFSTIVSVAYWMADRAG